MKMKNQQPDYSTQCVIDIYVLNIGALLEGTKQKNIN